MSTFEQTIVAMRVRLQDSAYTTCMLWLTRDEVYAMYALVGMGEARYDKGDMCFHAVPDRDMTDPVLKAFLAGGSRERSS